MISFINDLDSITLESYKDIPIGNIIILTVENKIRFYNVRALHRWILINPVEPSTKIHFNKKKI